MFIFGGLIRAEMNLYKKRNDLKNAIILLAFVIL